MGNITNRITLLLFVLIASSMACNHSSLGEEQSYKRIENTKGTLKDTLLKIGTKTLIHWDAKEERIQRDSLFMHLNSNFDEYKFDLINSISDTSSIHWSACYKQNQIRKGDVAFMILSEIRAIPLFQVFQVQFDIYDVNCRYPEGLFNYIEENRELVRKQTHAFLIKDK